LACGEEEASEESLDRGGGETWAKLACGAGVVASHQKWGRLTIMILLANASNMLRSDMSLVLGFIKALVTPLPSEALEFYNLKYLVAW
jgi:hypothetical protein